MENEAPSDKRDDELEPRQAQHNEETADSGEVLHVQAGFAPEQIREDEKPYALRNRYRERARELMKAMQERHRQRDRNEPEVDEDDGLPGLEIEDLPHGIDECEAGDEISRHIHDPEPATDGSDNLGACLCEPRQPAAPSRAGRCSRVLRRPTRIAHSPGRDP